MKLLKKHGLYTFLIIAVMAVSLLSFAKESEESQMAAVYNYGSRGLTVYLIQQRLQEWGYYSGELDGIYGTSTADAVRLFQQNNGLTSDGIAGDSTLSALGIVSQVSQASDLDLLARAIYGEGRGEPYEGQVAVGAVVINRVLSSVFPNTLSGVIYQSGQFEPVSTGRLALALAENRATDSCYRAADEAMSGVTNVGNCVFFRTPIPGLTGINIGGHVFY